MCDTVTVSNVTMRRIWTRVVLGWVCCTAWTLAPAANAWAGNIIWTNAGGGTFLDPQNWNPHTVPTLATDVAVFNLNASFTVDAQPINTVGALSDCSGTNTSTAVALGRWLVHTSDVTLVLCAGATASSTSASEASVTVGDGGRLAIAGGVFNSVNTVIGEVSGSMATVVLINPDAQWVSTGDLLVGKIGQGELRVLDGALLTAALLTVGDSSDLNTVSVSGRPTANRPSEIASSGPILVGRSGRGHLSVEAGGKVSTNVSLLFGTVQAGDSQITVTGGEELNDGFHPSTLTVNDLFVMGSAADTTLVVEDGGKMTARSATIAIEAGGTNHIQVQGGTDNISTLEFAQELLLGNSPLASQTTLEVRSGGKIKAATVRLGSEVGGATNAEIEGASTTARPSLLEVGQTLTIGSKAASELTVGNGARATATLVKVGDGGTGKLKLAGPATARVTATDEIQVSAQGEVSGTGELVAPQLVNDGVISPGASPGTLNVTGNLAQNAGGKLVIEVAGLAAGEFDVLNVSGSIALNGTVEFRFLNGFALQPGNIVTFAIGGQTISGAPQVTALNVAGNGSTSPAQLPPGTTLEVGNGTARLKVPPAVLTWYRDADGDGYGDPADTVQAVDQPTGYVSDNQDCNDASAAVHPNAAEVCGNSIDEDCNGQDAPCSGTWYRDADSDGFGNPNDTTQSVTRPAGYVFDNTDCHDGNANIHPGATEVCGNGTDENCDGFDAPCAVTWYRDADGDGYGDPNDSTQSVTQPIGYVAGNTDCDDTNAGIHPDAAEVCGNSIDEDCNGQDAACSGTWYRDADGDGFGDPNDSTQSVAQPAGYVSDNQDCNDADAAVHPGAADVCGNGIDEDCDGQDAACPPDTNTCGSCGAGVVPLTPLMMLTLLPARWTRRRVRRTS